MRTRLRSTKTSLTTFSCQTCPRKKQAANAQLLEDGTPTCCGRPMVLRLGVLFG